MTSAFIRLLCFIIIGTGDAALGDDHVCITYEDYVDTVPVQEWVPVRAYKTEWCFSIPPRCTKEYTTYKRQVVQKAVVKNRAVENCCQGYMRLARDGNCLPVCSALCQHGECIAPETCSCHSGFYGHRCDKPCAVGYWGQGCLKTCDCENNSTCDTVHGLCDCSEGWQGVRCDVPCDAGRFGKGCELRCNCEGCDSVTGECEEGTSTKTTTVTETTTTADDISTLTNLPTVTETTTAAAAGDISTSTNPQPREGNQVTESDQPGWTGYVTTEDTTDPWEQTTNGDSSETAYSYDGNATMVDVTEGSGGIALLENLSAMCGVVVFIFLLIIGSVMIGHCRKIRKITYRCKSDRVREEDFVVHRFSGVVTQPVKPVFDASTCTTVVDLVTEKPRMMTFKPVQGDRVLRERVSDWPKGEQKVH